MYAIHHRVADTVIDCYPVNAHFEKYVTKDNEKSICFTKITRIDRSRFQRIVFSSSSRGSNSKQNHGRDIQRVCAGGRRKQHKDISLEHHGGRSRADKGRIDACHCEIRYYDNAARTNSSRNHRIGFSAPTYSTLALMADRLKKSW
uniref:Uncharacterized protein n=1 Tax=Trichogramma kaykai TaxID=54128 RepID=A0ABD2WIH2_9HYME